MSPLATLEAVPRERLAALRLVTPKRSVERERPADPSAWDNRPSWDNWSRR